MKTLFTKRICIISVIVLLIGATLPAMAQYSKTVLESTEDYTAMAKDAAGNIYVTQSIDASHGQIVKYINGTGTPLTIFTGLNEGDDLGPGGDLPWGLAVASNGDVYCTTDFTGAGTGGSNNYGNTAGGNIIKLASNNGTSGTVYTPSIYQSEGAYYTALAFDKNDNLYVTQYDPSGNTGNVGGSYAIYEYTKGTPAHGAGTNLYDFLTESTAYSYPTGLAVASNFDIYVTNPYDEDGSDSNGGQVLKLLKSTNYSFASRVIISSNQYASALTLDASGNLYTEEYTAAAPAGYKLLEYAGGAAVTPTVVYAPLDAYQVFAPFGVEVINSNRIYLNDGENSTNGGAVWELSSSNADLTSLTISSGTLTPVFAAGTTSYTDAVTNATTSITVTPTVSNSSATVKVNGSTVTSGSTSQSIALSVGANTINTVVTAFDGVTAKTYSIVVTRAASSVATLSNLLVQRIKNGSTSTAVLNPPFNSGTNSYAINAPNSTSNVTITPTVTDATATVKVNGTTVASGSASSNISLAVGPNTITTVVTAQDGTTTDTYTVSIDRRNSLGQLDGLYEPVSVNQDPALQLENGIVVHPAVSPNGDGINDVFTIDGLNAYPNNKVTIMTRGGVVVYQTAGYDNSTKVFDGHSSINGTLQQAGTYFYTLDYIADGESKHKTGFIILKY